MIFDIIGTPNEEEKSFITDKKALDYLDSFDLKQRADLSKRFPAITDLALDFLFKMLTFNPFLRPTIQECLDHPYLKTIADYFKEDLKKQIEVNR